MADLTIKQENFCLEIIKGVDQAAAYRTAFPNQKMSDKTIHEAASRLMKNSKVMTRLDELRKPVVEAAQVSLEQHLNDLKKLRDDAWASEKYGPAIQAEISRGKASGHYIERIETGNPGDFDKLNDSELEQSIIDAARIIESARVKSKVSIATQGKAKATERK